MRSFQRKVDVATFRGGYQYPVFILQPESPDPIKKECDMCIFLSLSYPKLLKMITTGYPPEYF